LIFSVPSLNDPSAGIGGTPGISGAWKNSVELPTRHRPIGG
jgi:hypothetical protein